MTSAVQVPRLALRPRDREDRRPTDPGRDPMAHAAALVRLAGRIEQSIPMIRRRDEQQQARGAARRCRAWARELLRSVRKAG